MSHTRFLPLTERFTCVFTSNGLLLGRSARPSRARLIDRRLFSTSPLLQNNKPPADSGGSSRDAARANEDQEKKPITLNFPKGKYTGESLPEGWEDDPDFGITAFSQLPHKEFGFNQHMQINEEFKEALRQILWRFKAPIRYAFAYGSGVFSQSAPDSNQSAPSLSPHPNPPEAIAKWQRGGGKVIDFIFGVSYTQHWHDLNLQQHRDHYSFLGSLGSGVVSAVQDKWGAGVYFNPYITVDGTMIKYGVANLDTIASDLSGWNSLYLAGRLQKPVKILRDDPRVRLANQVNLISAVRTALLMLPEKFTERQLYEAITGISYHGDPRMRFKSEDPNKVPNIVANQLPNFRLLYNALIEDLPNVTYTDARTKDTEWLADDRYTSTLQQDMDPVKRGNMVRRLPLAFRNKIYFQYQKKFGIPGAEYQKMLEASADEDAQSFKRREGGEFERRIAAEQDIPDMMQKAIKQTVEWPSASQSIKGIFTGGPLRSWKYLGEKRKKGRVTKSDTKSQ